MQFNPLNLKAFNFFTGKPIIWNGGEDELLCSEIFAADLFSGTKRSTVPRAGCKISGSKPVNKLQGVYIKVDQRAMSDGFNASVNFCCALPPPPSQANPREFAFLFLMDSKFL